MTIWTELIDLPHQVAWVDAGGVRTRSLQAGSGPVAVFLHGTSGHLEAFVRNLPSHAEHFSCHAIDMLGHGLTDKPTTPYRIDNYVQHLVEYLDAIGASTAHIIGESLGGWVGARFAARHPDRIGKLTLLAPGGTVANPAVMERIKTSTRAAVERDDIALTRARLELLMHDPAKDVSDELVEVRHLLYHRPEFVAGIDHLLCLQAPEARNADLLRAAELQQIAAPTLIVWGRENPFGELPEADFLNANIAGSRLELFEACGHWPQHEHAERFNQLNLAFLLGTDGGAG